MARTSLEHSKIVLGAILPDRRDLLDKALAQLNETHFPDTQYRTMYLLLDRYVQTTGSVLTRQALLDILSNRKLDAGKQALYLETYDALANSDVPDADFKWSMEQLKELAAEKKTNEAITSGMEILTRGSTDKKGKDLIGHTDARAHVLEKFAEIDRDLSMQESPEGDARLEAADILAELETAHKNKGVKLGVPGIDDTIGGYYKGELGLVVGYSSSGKTSLATIQLPWSAAIEQGKNVVIFTTETLRPQVRRKILCRHSKHPMFESEWGINSAHLKKGKDYLTPEEARLFPIVLDDFAKNPNYGKLVIVQVPRSSTISTIEGKAFRFQREFEVDLIVIDSINLLKPDRRFNTTREELATTLKEAKQFATTFNDGSGVPLVSPWQTSRDAWKQAQEAGSYNSSALAETAEATASSDTAITILEPLENEQREADVKGQVVKSRDDLKALDIELHVDYATCHWTSRRSTTNSIDSLIIPGSIGGMW